MPNDAVLFTFVTSSIMFVFSVAAIAVEKYGSKWIFKPMREVKTPELLQEPHDHQKPSRQL
jgi:hypothetical protein